jgi:transglutaminase-like putative cysteine protease
MVHPRRFMILWALALLAVLPAARAEVTDWRLEDERWYEVKLAGATAGWMHEGLWADDERYRSETRTRMSISRGPVEITLEINSTFTETHDGRPIMMRLVQDMGIQTVHTEWRFEDDRIVETTEQGGRKFSRDLPLPEGKWLTPMAVRRHFIEKRRAGVEKITYRTLDMQNGVEPITVTMIYEGEDRYRFNGRAVPVTAWKTTTSLIQVEANEHYDDSGRAVFQAVDLPLGRMVSRMTTKAAALAADGERAPELLMATFVRPDRPIARSGQATSATLRLRVGMGDLPAIPSAGAQRVEPGADGASATLRVDMNARQAAGEVDREIYLARSAMIDTADEVIREMTADALRGHDGSPLERAGALRAYVNRIVGEKNLDTAFATASETARERSGDCSEHAVLLCAMLRADGIPARVAIGLIYADRFLGERGIFGWHMWTQALIDGQWVDLDATLPQRYHAAHILTGTTALSDSGLAAELATTLMLIGNLEIEVLDVGYE